MKHSLFLLYTLSIAPVLSAMESINTGESSKHSSIKQHPMHNRVDTFTEQEVAVEVEPHEHLSKVAWENELRMAIKECRSFQLIELLNEDNRPQPSRGGLPNFTPNLTALELIRIKKEEKLLILTNKCKANAKYCRCCNPSFVWKRLIAPGAISLFAFGQLGFSVWAVQRAASISLIQYPNDNLQAFIAAGPSIGSLIASVGGLFFSLTSAYDSFKLKEVEKAYNYYVLAEHNINTQNTIEAQLKEQSITLKQVLANQTNSMPELRSLDE